MVMTEEEFRKSMGMPTGGPGIAGCTPSTLQADPVPHQGATLPPLAVQDAPGSTISPTPTPGGGYRKIQVSAAAGTDIKKYPGRYFEGRYVGVRDITTKLGPQKVWNFDTAEGPMGVYGFSQFNRGMEQVAVGSQVRFAYQGTQLQDNKFGKKNVHQASIEVKE